MIPRGTFHCRRENLRRKVYNASTCVSTLSSYQENIPRPQNVSSLQDAGAMKLLRPLLLDVVPSIQQNAAAALGRLASHSGYLAEDIVANEILPQLVYSLAEQNRFYKRAAAFVLRSVAKHSPELALAVVVCFLSYISLFTLVPLSNQSRHERTLSFTSSNPTHSPHKNINITNTTGLRSPRSPRTLP